MGHESEPLDDFVEAHRTCLNDLMYFPSCNAYGLSSVAGNMEKLAALQNEFENVKNKLDDDGTVREEGDGSHTRLSLWPQIEATFKQMDITVTELECFKALQKQEQLATSHRINNLPGEVQKQKELEKTLQTRYESVIEELEKTQNMMDQYRLQAQERDEMEANNHAHESTETKSVEHGHAESSHDGTAEQQVDIVQEQATSSPSHDMDVDSDKMQMTHDTDANAIPVAENVDEKVEISGPNHDDNCMEETNVVGEETN
ncbi:Cell division cycle 5-like protein, partial [Mucuna pruriens]